MELATVSERLAGVVVACPSKWQARAQAHNATPSPERNQAVINAGAGRPSIRQSVQNGQFLRGPG